jgi:hypothetical protein
MNSRLISKTQYKRSEQGEFHDAGRRDLGETLLLIENYPWASERAGAPVELTCPSITIEHPAGTCLKIGIYFSGKFALYFLNARGRLYFEVADTLLQACQRVSEFFQREDFRMGKRQLAFNPAAHFRTKSFEYEVNFKAALQFFRFPVYLTPAILLFGWMKSSTYSAGFSWIAGPIAVLMLYLLCSPLIYFYFDYQAFDRHKFLRLSTGHHDFMFGTTDKARVYKKEDIAEIAAYGGRNSRSFWSFCEVFVITFHNGEYIQFTSLLISGGKLRKKFPDHSIVERWNLFPALHTIEYP